MAYQDKFSIEEWRTLQFSVLWVFHAIAEVDGIIDEDESAALFGAFEGEIDFPNKLATEVLNSINKDRQTILSEFGADAVGIPMGIKAAAELVEEKLSPEEAREFKQTLLYMGVAFAKASGETPGETAGPRVSGAERAAILTVTAILRLSLDDLMI